MELQSPILTFFRPIPEEHSVDVTQQNADLRENLKQITDMSFKATPWADSNNSLSCVVLFAGREETLTDDLEDETGNNSTEENRVQSCTAEEGDDTINCEQVTAARTENIFSTVGQQFEINQSGHFHCALINPPECQSLDKVLEDKNQANTTEHAHCLRKTKCTDPDCDCKAQMQDVKEEFNQDSRINHLNAETEESNEEFNTHDYLECEDLTIKKVPQTKRVLITVTRTEKTNFDENVEVNNPSPDGQHAVIPPANNVPSPGSTIPRGTLSSGSPMDKQLPTIFTGLQVLRKTTVGPGHDTVAQIQPFTEEMKTTNQGSFLDQISLLLNPNKTNEEGEDRMELLPKELTETKKTEICQELQTKHLKTEDTSESLLSTKPPVSSAEAAFHAFKAFFTPKPLKKQPAENEDPEATRKKTWTEKDSLRAFFERNSNKTADSKSETSSPVEEEWTPGRLQAVWPPPKEEKVGLKYTEAEHQAALLQLKRECKEEVEKLQEDFWKELSKLRVENEATVSQLKLTLAELQSKLSKLGSIKRGELRDAAVSTQDDKFPHKAFRNVCIQTDRETFIKKDDDRDKRDCSPTLQQKVTPKKLDLASISINLAGRREEGPPCQSEGVQAPTNTVNAPPPPLSPMQSHNQQIKAPPPPPPLPCPSQIMTDKQTFKTPPPPPLAPFMSAVSPPPPPPPPFTSHLTSTLSADPRKPVVEPSCPMKPLYWTRIQIEDNKNNTVWNILKEPNIMNTVEFEDLFAKNTTRLKRKPLVENYKKTKTKKIIKLLDSKRSQAVGILMSSLHLEIKDIRQAILTVDNSVVDLETIEALYENRGQPEELEKIKTHHETSKEEELKLLDKPEQFLYELSQISDFAERARCIIFKAAFNDGMASIQHKLHIMSSVCEALLEQNGVKDVLGLILALGNHMNGGNRVRGQADGFNLEILPKLKDVKSRDNRISLVDYMVSYYLHNVDKNAGTDKSTFPLPEPQDVFLAAQLNFEDLNAELKKLGKDLTGCEKNVQKVCLNSPEEHLQPFKDRMEAFLITARKEHIGASSQFITAQKSFQDLCVYFGLKPKAGEKEVTSSHFFMLWFEFCADFNTRWKKENRNFTKERLKEAQQSVKRITAEKKVETRKINSNSLKERLRQKEANKTQI
ncbi:formin [Stigmatopora argus]